MEWLLKKRLYFFIFFIILIFQPFWPAEVLGHFLKFMVMYKVFRVIYKCKWSKWMYIFPKLNPDTLYSNIRIIIKRMEFTQQRNILVWLLIFYFLPKLRIICENKFFFYHRRLLFNQFCFSLYNLQPLVYQMTLIYRRCVVGIWECLLKLLALISFSWKGREQLVHTSFQLRLKPTQTFNNIFYYPSLWSTKSCNICICKFLTCAICVLLIVLWIWPN